MGAPLRTAAIANGAPPDVADVPVRLLARTLVCDERHLRARRSRMRVHAASQLLWPGRRRQYSQQYSEHLPRDVRKREGRCLDRARHRRRHHQLHVRLPGHRLQRPCLRQRTAVARHWSDLRCFAAPVSPARGKRRAQACHSSSAGACCRPASVSGGSRYSGWSYGLKPASPGSATSRRQPSAHLPARPRRAQGERARAFVRRFHAELLARISQVVVEALAVPDEVDLRVGTRCTHTRDVVPCAPVMRWHVLGRTRFAPATRSVPVAPLQWMKSG